MTFPIGSPTCDTAPVVLNIGGANSPPGSLTQALVIGPLLVTIPEACRIRGCSRSRLYEDLQACRIKAVKDGRRTLIDVDSLREYVRSLPSAYPPSADNAT